MTDAEFMKTAPYALLCREFEISTDDDGAAELGQADRERFFRECDRLKAELYPDPIIDYLDRYPTICGECGASTKHSLTKIVSRPKPYPAGTRVVVGMPTTEEMRVCNSHDEATITNWPKPLAER